MKRVEYDINESEYKFNINNYTFYFSSLFNLERFKENFIDYVKVESDKIRAKYKVNIILTDYLLMVFYKKIETRGFRVLYSTDNDIIEVDKDCIFIVGR